MSGARELTTIGQSDERMAQDLNNQAQQPRTRMRSGSISGRVSFARWRARIDSTASGGADEPLRRPSAREYAHSDRSNIEFRRRVANDMAELGARGLRPAREHEEHANRMQGFLNQLNQQQPQQVQPQQGNPPGSNRRALGKLIDLRRLLP